MLFTFYNAVICNIIMFGSVCWGGNISKLDRGRLEKVVKKSGAFLTIFSNLHLILKYCGKATGQFKTLHEKRLYRKLKQILNDPTHPIRHYFDSRRSNRSGIFFTSENKYKPL